MEAFTFNTFELILLSAAGVLLVIQLFYYLGIYNRIHTRNIADKKNELHFTKELPPLSVIICARNESANLRQFLPAILEQDYPQFEVIVINDGSTDESEEVPLIRRLYWDTADTSVARDGCINAYHSMLYLHHCVIWDLPLPESHIWDWDVIWHTGKRCFSKKKDTLPT